MEKPQYHPTILMLLDKFNLKLENRNASDNYTFDGKTIATHSHICTVFLHGLNEDRRERPNRFAFNELYGKNDIVYYTDHDILHEVCHFIVATEKQRSIPEYGLHIGVTLAGAFGNFRKVKHECNEIIYEIDNERLWLYNDKVHMEKSFIIDYAAQLLEIHLGRKYNIPAKFACGVRNRFIVTEDHWSDFYDVRINGRLNEYDKRLNEYNKNNRLKRPINTIKHAEKLFQSKIKQYDL